MSSVRVLKDLLQEPIGPYLDRDILHETACQMRGNIQLVLYSFILELNGSVTGLDESENPLDENDDRTFRFRGVLEIANPEWLSDNGLKIVETELNLRATERALREGERRPPQLTLEDLFRRRLLSTSNDSTRHKEDDMRLTVQIQGKKNMPAVFMNSPLVPNGLLWNSKDHNRNYQIATMDVETFSLSENFFWRWRLVALMKKVAEKFPWVPPKKRTPIWFVNRYMEKFACPAEDKHQRVIFDDEDDSDVDETGRTVTPRHILKPHTSEMLSLFAAQANWFITNDGFRREKLVDIKSWEDFAREARKARKEAARRGVTWGYPVGEEASEGLESSEERSGSESELERMVRENPVIGKSNKAVVRKIELARAKDRGNHDIKMSISSESGSEDDPPGGADYVSDFSEPSVADTEENDSDSWREEEEAVDRIPWQLQLPPLLPDVDGRWWCPLRECERQIDLHDLTEEERRGVPEDLVEYIRQKQWRNAAYDEKVLQGFRYMVTNHYSKHFEERGVKIERREGRTRLAFINRNDRQRRNGGEVPVRGSMPARGTLGGESRVVPSVHHAAQG